MHYSRMTLSPCDWHRKRDTGLRFLFLSVRCVPPNERSHWDKLQCMVRTGWITPIIFSLGRRRKHRQFQKKQGSVCASAIQFFHWQRCTFTSTSSYHLGSCTYIGAFWVILANCPMPAPWEGWCILWGLCLGSSMVEKAEDSGVP